MYHKVCENVSLPVFGIFLDHKSSVNQFFFLPLHDLNYFNQ